MAYSLFVHEAKRRKRDHSQTGGMVMAKRNSRKPTPKSRRVSKEKPAAGAHRGPGRGGADPRRHEVGQPHRGLPETDWPYVTANFARKPPLGAFKDAPLGKTVSYQRVVQTLDQMKGCLAASSPIVLGISV